MAGWSAANSPLSNVLDRAPAVVGRSKIPRTAWRRSFLYPLAKGHAAKAERERGPRTGVQDERRRGSRRGHSNPSCCVAGSSTVSLPCRSSRSSLATMRRDCFAAADATARLLALHGGPCDPLPHTASRGARMPNKDADREDSRTSEGLELLRAFSAIESAKQRMAIISLARTFSRLSARYPSGGNRAPKRPANRYGSSGFSVTCTIRDRTRFEPSGCLV